MRTLPPIELWDDPDNQLGEHPEYDMKNKDNQARLRAEAAELPGPDVANIWVWENPCKSFSDWNLENGGTRTFENPLGDGSRWQETEGNEFTNLLVDSCLQLHATGKAFLFENQASTG